MVPVVSVCPAGAGEAPEAACSAVDNQFAISWDESHRDLVVVRSGPVDQVAAHLGVLVAGLVAGLAVVLWVAHSAEVQVAGQVEVWEVQLISQVALLRRLTDRGDLVTQAT